MSAHRELQPPEGVSLSAWEQLATLDGNRWAIPERNADGEITGNAYRLPDGSKSFKTGSRRGLIVAWPLDTYAGSSHGNPIFICEGASDTAALLQFGLDAVGVPMTGKSGDMLAELLKGRHVAIVADNDEPGMRGANKIAEQLVLACKSVRIINLPEDCKDAREAVLNGANMKDFIDLAEQAESFSIPLSGLGLTGNEFHLIPIGDLPPAEEPDWLWPGFLVRGAFTLLTGLWKAGKSTLLAHLLRDLYRGSGLVDTPINGPVILVTEEPMALWSARRDKLGLDAQRIMILERPTLARCTDIQWRRLIEDLLSIVKETNAELVVFDTLPGIWPVGNENDAGEVLDSLSPMRDLAQAGAAVLAMHHPRKNESLGFTSARGSGALSGFPDILVEFGRINGDPKSTQRTLKAVGRFDGIPPEVIIDLREDGYVLLGERKTANKEDELMTIAEILSAQDSTVTVETLQEKWPRNPRIGMRRLREMLKSGAESGLWRQSGSGRRNDPFRFSSLEASTHSIPFRPDPKRETEIESNRLEPISGSTYSNPTFYPNGSVSTAR